MARVSARLSVVLLAAAAACVAGCSRETSPPSAPRAASWRAPKDLADWGLFQVVDGRLVHKPRDGVLPYDLNTPLFSDYTTKHRFVKLPPGGKARYHEKDVFEFPVETVIAKTFSYPHDMRDPAKGERLLETRILYRHPAGWKALTYQWNQEQTAATLLISGAVVPSTWIDESGRTAANDYIVPDQTKCASCHDASKSITPIGPRARHLNKVYPYAEGPENQLAHWARVGVLEGAPSDPKNAPRAAVWNDPSTGDVDRRARAWLEINCAHCHNPAGPARNAGLDLTYDQTNPELLGVWKTPVAVGRGGGGRRYSIVPGRPDESILLFRLDSLDPGVMMPEVARRMIHAEGVALIREWIESMADPLNRPPEDDGRAGG